MAVLFLQPGDESSQDTLKREYRQHGGQNSQLAQSIGVDGGVRSFL